MKKVFIQHNNVKIDKKEYKLLEDENKAFRLCYPQNSFVVMPKAKPKPPQPEEKKIPSRINHRPPIIPEKDPSQMSYEVIKSN